MFNKKLKKQIDELDIEINEINRKLLNDIVSCEVCGCLIFKKSSVPVLVISYGNHFKKYFCNSHRPKYDEIILDEKDTKYFSENRRRVDENGKPLTTSKT